MSFLSFEILQSYYFDDPKAFLEELNGDSSISRIYQSLLAQIITSLQNTFTSTGSKVVRIDMDGNIMLSDNNAFFGETKEDVKDFPGKVKKIGSSIFAIADSMGKRAFIIDTKSGDYGKLVETLYVDGLSEADKEFIDVILGQSKSTISLSKIIWEYRSSRYISDFHIVPQDDVVISIRDDTIDDTDIFIRQNSNIIWQNDSASPISIYSGTTTYDQFQNDPDLNLYGDLFKSGVLEPGERFSYKFVSVGEVNYFIYPGILTGKITVTRNRVSSRDQYILLENDGLESPFSSRVIKVNSWGNVIFSFGQGYLVKPRDAKCLLNNGVIIST